MTDGDPFCADSAKLSRSLLMTGVPLIGVGDGRVTSEAVVKQSDGLVLIAANARPYSPTSFSLYFAQSSGTQSIRSSMPYFFARLVIWSDIAARVQQSASSAKYFSKPAGEMSSSNLAGLVVAFLKVC